jgi:hypothetical protein
MKRLVLAFLALLLFTHPASASVAAGNGALALAALIAANSPVLAESDKRILAALFEGQLDSPFAAGRKISVQADHVTCSAGNVDISRHSCALTFSKQTATLAGRKAHELYATLTEIGVPPDGAAGTIYESVSHVSCTIDPNGIKQRDGGGATCHFDTGGP